MFKLIVLPSTTISIRSFTLPPTLSGLQHVVGGIHARFVHPDDVGIIAGEIKTATESVGASGYRDIENPVIYGDDGTVGHMYARFLVERDAQGRAVRGYGVSQDVTLRKRNEETLQRLNRALRTLSAGNATLVRAEREPEFLQAMCRVLVEVGGYAAAAISYAENDEAKSVHPVAWAGDHVDFIQSARISWSDDRHGQGPTGTAIRTGKLVVNADFASNPDVLPWRRDALAHGFTSSIAFPLKEGAKIFGALTIFTQQRDIFDPEEIKLSDDLAFGIITIRTREAREEGVARLRKAMTSTVLALAATLERRDPYRAGHQRNVAKLSSAIAAKVDIPPPDRDGIYLAAVIHDIGKIQVPGEILSNPCKLTDLEFEIIKTHAQAGYEIVKGIDFPWPVAEMILQHHERLDGSGYPHDLKGNEILPGARILAVADVVEAMMAHRPYRPGLGVEAALAEIQQGRGARYDAAAVDACVSLIRDGFTF